jgi:hypothetical protein
MGAREREPPGCGKVGDAAVVIARDHDEVGGDVLAAARDACDECVGDAGGGVEQIAEDDDAGGVERVDERDEAVEGLIEQAAGGDAGAEGRAAAGEGLGLAEVEIGDEEGVGSRPPRGPRRKQVDGVAGEVNAV